MDFRKAPLSKNSIFSAEDLVNKLKILLGKEFKLSYKPRTDGSKLRKLISENLNDNEKKVALDKDYAILSE